jgi:hypothetical protein
MLKIKQNLKFAQDRQKIYAKKDKLTGSLKWVVMYS